MTKEKLEYLINGLESVESSNKLEQLLIDYCICEHNLRYYEFESKELMREVINNYSEDELNKGMLAIHNKTKDIK